MRVVSLGRLREFWQQPGRHDSEQALKTWYNVTRKARWSSFANIRRDYPSADLAHGRVVFDIRGNNYRLICAIDFIRHGVLTLWVGTHADYDTLMRNSGRLLKARFGDSP